MSYGTSNPLLDARLEGLFRIVAPVGTSTHYYNFDFSNLDAGDGKGFFNGIQIKTNGANFGDYVTLSTEYYVPPLAEWKRYKKFGKNFYVTDNDVSPIILFPTKPSTGVRLKVVYENTGDSEVGVLANGWIFVDQQSVDTTSAKEGDDW